MYASYTDLHIQVLLKDKQVAKSPYMLKGEKNYFKIEKKYAIIFVTTFRCFLYLGAVYHESCDCPELSDALWEKNMHCPATFSQIENDLSVFPSVDPDRNAHEIPQRFEKRHSLCHYTIKNNQVIYVFLFMYTLCD